MLIVVVSSDILACLFCQRSTRDETDPCRILDGEADAFVGSKVNDATQLGPFVVTLLKRSKSSLDKIRVYKGCAAHDTVFLVFDCELSLVVGNVDERQEAWRAVMADSARELDTGHPLSRSCGSKGKRAPSIESQELQPSRKEVSCCVMAMTRNENSKTHQKSSPKRDDGRQTYQIFLDRESSNRQDDRSSFLSCGGTLPLRGFKQTSKVVNQSRR